MAGGQLRADMDRKEAEAEALFVKKRAGARAKKKAKEKYDMDIPHCDNPDADSLNLIGAEPVDDLHYKLWTDLALRDRNTDIRVLLNTIFSLLIVIDPIKLNSPCSKKLVDSLKEVNHKDTLPMIEEFIHTPRMGGSKY